MVGVRHRSSSYAHSASQCFKESPDCETTFVGGSWPPLSGFWCAEANTSHARFVRSANARQRSVCLRSCVVFPRASTGHYLFLVRNLHYLSHSIECVTTVGLEIISCSLPSWLACIFVPSMQLCSLFQSAVFSDTVMFQVLLHSAVALVINVFFSVVCRYRDSHTDVVVFCCLQPLLESAGLHTVALQECPQDVQNQCRRLLWLRCRRKLYWRTTHHAPLQVPLVRLSLAASPLGQEDRSMFSAHTKICSLGKYRDGCRSHSLGHPQAPSAKASLSTHSCSHSSLPGVLVRAGKFDGSSLVFYKTTFVRMLCGAVLLLPQLPWDGFPRAQPCLRSCRILLLHMPST